MMHATAAHPVGPPAQPTGQGPLHAEPALERRADLPGGEAHRRLADAAHHLQGKSFLGLFVSTLPTMN